MYSAKAANPCVKKVRSFIFVLVSFPVRRFLMASCCAAFLCVYSSVELATAAGGQRNSGRSAVTTPPPVRPRQEPMWVAPDEMEKKLLHRVEPTYPQSFHAAAEGTQVEKKDVLIGSTIPVALIINEEGEVWDARVIDYSSWRGRNSTPSFKAYPNAPERAALQAVKQWRYAPTYEDGVPLPVKTIVWLQRNPAPIKLRLALDQKGRFAEQGRRLQKNELSERVGGRPGAIAIDPDYAISWKVLQHSLQHLESLGAADIRLSGPFVFHKHRIFYDLAAAGTLGLIPNGVAFKSSELSKDLTRNDLEHAFGKPLPPKIQKPLMVSYRFFFDHKGQVVDLERWNGPEMPDFESKLRAIHALPIRRGKEGVPVYATLPFRFNTIILGEN
jgi:hypothetical protein